MAVPATIPHPQPVFRVFLDGPPLATNSDMSPPRLSLLPHAALTERIICGFHDTVHELGCGFSERVCQRALQIVLQEKGLLVDSDFPMEVRFRGRTIGSFQADLVVERLVIVEVKATTRIEDYAKAQILNYLKCAGGGVGLLLNFGHRPECRRFVMGDPENSLPHLSKAP